MTKLSEHLAKWRADRPDEWQMDEFIREARKLEASIESQIMGACQAVWKNATKTNNRPDYQKRCIDIGFEYWRASDSHGVTCTSEQAIELLQEVLGVEVEIEEPSK